MMDLGSEIAALEDDMQEFNLEKSVKNSLKTPEELDKLTVDESLNDIDRAVFLLSSGQEVQCISVIRNLPHLLRHWQVECLRRVMPKVKEMLHLAGTDVQLASTEVFLAIAKDDLVSSSNYTIHFLRTIITNIEGRDATSSQAWLSTLLNVILHLPRDTVKREILGLAIAKGQLSQPTSSRISCCSILGAIATKFDSYVVKKDVVHTVKQLCQDVDYEVRASMCAHLHKIAKGLGPEETKKSILDEVLELARDEESSVREAAFEAVLNMTQLLDDESLVESVVPLVCKYCEQAVENEDATLLCITHNFGRLCHNISYNFNSDQRSWLLSCYRYLCKLGYTTPSENSSSPTGESTDLSNNHSRSPPSPNNIFAGMGSSTSSPVGQSSYDSFSGYPKTPSSSQRPSAVKLEMYLECRRSCAYNLPAMVQFTGRDNFKTELLDSTTRMCTDPDITVRKSIASGLHEVAQILDDQAYLLHGHLVSLLRERYSATVIEALITQLTETMYSIMSRGSFGLAESKSNATSELIAALLAATSRLEQQWPSSWRALENLVIHMQHLPNIMTSDHIYYKFVPVVFKLINSNRYLPVKEAAVCTMCIFIRHNRRQEQKKEMCNRLVQDLCYGRSYKSRILFFSACRHLMKLFSKSFFKEHLFEHVLNLFHDPVANVRLCLCKILPSLKSLLKLPSDRAFHQQLESSVRRLLSSEKDRDVSNSIRYAILELDRTEVAMESLTQHMFMDEDIQDQKKEEEERMLIEKEERSKDDDRSLKGHGSGGSNSSVTKAGGNARSDKSHHHHKKRSSRNSLAASSSLTAVASAKLNGNRDKNKSSHHQTASTQQTPVFMHQKDGSVNSTAFQSYGMGSLQSSSSHSPIPSKISTNHVSPSPPTNPTGSKSDHSSVHHSVTSTKSTNNVSPNHSKNNRSTGMLFLQNKTERHRSSSLLSHSSHSPSSSFRSSPNTHGNEPRGRKGSSSSLSSVGSGGSSRIGSKTLQQAASNAKSSVKRKTSNVGANNLHKKSEKNGQVR